MFYLQRSIYKALIGESQTENGNTIDQAQTPNITVDTENINHPDIVTETEIENTEHSDSALIVESVQETSSTATESSGDTDIDFEIVTHEQHCLDKEQNEMAEYENNNGNNVTETESESNEATDQFTKPLQASKSLTDLELKRRRLR